MSPVETIYSSQTAGNYGVRKQKAKETKFGIFMRDQWMNYTDTSFVTVTPFYEEQITDLAMYTMQGDGKPEWQDYGFRPEYLFDASRNDGGFHTTNSSGKHHLIKLLLNVVKPINYGDLRFSKDPKTIILITRQTRRNTNYGVQTKPRIPTAVMMAGPVWELSNRLNPPAFLLASSLQKTVKEQS